MEIKFRGKRIDSDEWVCGNLVKIRKTKDFLDPVLKETIQVMDCWVVGIQQYFPNNGKYYSYREFEVVPETIGQYTGLKDQSGNKIFEGDIVRCWSGNIQDKLDYRELIGVVEYIKPYFRVSGNELAWNAEFLEVIGNIHDNPELLEKR